jgi:hypothetical protein
MGRRGGLSSHAARRHQQSRGNLRRPGPVGTAARPLQSDTARLHYSISRISRDIANGDAGLREFINVTASLRLLATAQYLPALRDEVALAEQWIARLPVRSGSRATRN